jgi:hypothetical protein
MPRKLTPNRWNWSQKDEKWIYIEKYDNVEKYYYRIQPPKEFMDLTMKLKELNDILVITKDPEENNRLFNKMMKISKRLQCMGKVD